MDKKKILEIVAGNLKKLLNKSNISPSELTKKCDVSAGSLSKIIKGQMSITIPMAMEIATGLGVDLSDLLAGLVCAEPLLEKTPGKVLENGSAGFGIGILSIDNKRLACVKNRQGQILGTSELEGGLDLAQTSSQLLPLIQESISHASPNQSVSEAQLRHSTLNLVTQSFEFAKAKVKFSTFALKQFCEVNLLADWQIFQLCLPDRENTVSLIIDKGVSLSYCHNGHLKKLGGWKFPVCDQGGENWLGMETVRHTIEAQEGYVSMSELARNMLAKFQGKIDNITEACFLRSNPDVYCSFTDLLFKAYFASDPAAIEIFERGFGFIHRLVQRVDQILGREAQIALSGSLAEVYRRHLKPERLVSSLSHVHKAALLADITAQYLLQHNLKNH